MIDLKKTVLKYSATADQSLTAAEELTRKMFELADPAGQADLLNYFAECHDFAANKLANQWGKPEQNIAAENRLQLHIMVAGCATYINLVSQWVHDNEI